MLIQPPEDHDLDQLVFSRQKDKKITVIMWIRQIGERGGTHRSQCEKNGINSNMRLCSFPVGSSELVTWLLLILEWQADWRVLMFCWALSKNGPHNVCVCVQCGIKICRHYCRPTSNGFILIHRRSMKPNWDVLVLGDESTKKFAAALHLPGVKGEIQDLNSSSSSCVSLACLLRSSRWSIM